jgi:hypothetical protein
MMATGKLTVSYGDGRPERAGKSGEVKAGPKGLTWSLDGSEEGLGVVRWDDITAWSTLELLEPRRLRSPKRWIQVTIAVADDLTVSLLAEPEEAAALTRQAQVTLPSGTVVRSSVG